MAGQIALQLYTVRNELQENPERTLEKIKAIGIDYVEVAPLPDGLLASRLSKMLASLGLEVAAVHCDLPLGDRTNQVNDLAKDLGCRQIIWHGWPRDPAFDTLDGINRLVEQFNEASFNATGRGLQLGLHNHWWEFELNDGRFPYRVILEKLSHDIFLEIDTYWVRAAGLDPAAVLRELNDRIAFLHVKDGSAQKGEPMSALGTGVMDFRSILQAASPKLEWLVVEFDECATDIWEAIQRSVDHLQDCINQLPQHPC